MLKDKPGVKKVVPGANEIYSRGQSNNGRARKSRSRWFKFTIDLSQPKHRRSLLLGFVGVNVLLIALLFVGYKGYSYSESAEFCGLACHPMEPQFVRYEHSAHANVDCVKCHIGPGAEFFIKSKIDGLRQVYALFTETFSRPIESPVHNLRPARETCEECHTPASFKDNIVKTVVHFDNDETNTRVLSTFILKMGGWQESTGESQGIHWHITNPVYYINADDKRQVITWVGIQQPDGNFKEYYARDMLGMAKTSFVKEAFEKGEVRHMDCIDCHNRTAHEIPPPEKLIDNAIEDGLISTEIPYIRAKAIQVLRESYNSFEEAEGAINAILDDFRKNMPEVFEEQNSKIVTAVVHLKQIYKENNFPEMGLNWETNPNNEHHTPSLGCFRCHDGKHVSTDEAGKPGEVISVECNLCHTVPIVGRGDDLLIEAPVIVGSIPDTHADFSWTIAHQNISEGEKQECYQCHGQGFCNNGVCHNLSHPPDMLYSHAEEYRKQGDQVCYTCHQNIHCTQCHPAGVVVNP